MSSHTLSWDEENHIYFWCAIFHLIWSSQSILPWCRLYKTGGDVSAEKGCRQRLFLGLSHLPNWALLAGGRAWNKWLQPLTEGGERWAVAFRGLRRIKWAYGQNLFNIKECRVTPALAKGNDRPFSLPDVPATQNDSCLPNSGCANKPCWLLRQETLWTARASNGKWTSDRWFYFALNIFAISFSLKWTRIPAKSELPPSGRPGRNLLAVVTKHWLHPKLELKGLTAFGLFPLRGNCYVLRVRLVAHIHSTVCFAWLRVSVPTDLHAAGRVHTGQRCEVWSGGSEYALSPQRALFCRPPTHGASASFFICSITA